MSRRIAVTGSSGFIGRNLVEALSAKGDDVLPIMRPFDPSRIADALRGTDAVVHLAGRVSAVRERDFVEANVEGTRAVAEGARRAGVPIVHISSLAAGGPAPSGAPRSEGDPPAPITAYGRSKLESEHVIAAIEGLRWTILRPTVVYGPRDRGMLPLFRMAARGVLPLVGRRTAAFMFVHVDDLIRAIDRAIDAGAHGETLFVAHPRPATTREVLDAVCAAVGRRAPIVPVPDAVLRVACAAGDLASRMRGRRVLLDSSRYRELAADGFVCRVERLRECLGVVAEIELGAGLARTATWYRSEGWL